MTDGTAALFERVSAGYILQSLSTTWLGTNVALSEAELDQAWLKLDAPSLGLSTKWAIYLVLEQGEQDRLYAGFKRNLNRSVLTAQSRKS